MPSHPYLAKSTCSQECSHLKLHKQLSLPHQSKFIVKTRSISSKDENPKQKLHQVTKQHTNSSHQAPLSQKLTGNFTSRHPHLVMMHHTSNSRLLPHRAHITLKTGRLHHLVHHQTYIDQQVTSHLYPATANRPHQTPIHLPTPHLQTPIQVLHNPTNSRLNIKLSLLHQQCPPHPSHHQNNPNPNHKPLSLQPTPSQHTRVKNPPTSRSPSPQLPYPPQPTHSISGSLRRPPNSKRT